MRIEVYFQRLRETIDACPAVRSFNVTYDKRGSYEGFIRGEVYFADDSILHLREFVDVESEHNVVVSPAPDLSAVLSEIETLVELL